MKLCILVSHPIQYFVPVYKRLSGEGSLDLSVLFHARVGVDTYFDKGFGRELKWDIPLLDGYHSIFLSDGRKLNGIQWKVIRELCQIRPDVMIVHGYSHPTNILGLLVAKVIGTKVVMRGDTRPSPRHGAAPIKSRLKRWFFKYVDGCFAIGSLNSQYYRSLGVAEDRIFFVPFCIDNSFFDMGVGRAAARRRVRAALDISTEARVVLFVAKLVPRKRARDLLDAIERLHQRFPETVVLFVGTGSEEASLRERARRSGLDCKFLGFKNQAELPEIYAAADIFVLPSAGEPWGLVVNEAMAAGLPVIVTDDVGSAADLVEGRGTGFIYKAGDIDELAAALSALLESPETIERFGRNARLLIESWSVSACSGAMVDAIRSLLNSRKL